MSSHFIKVNIQTLSKSIALGLIVLLYLSFSSCKNDIEKVKSFDKFTTAPVESAKDITVIRSDSGNIQMLMTSKQLDRYEGEQMYTKFPKGLKVLFYDQMKMVKTILTANYAINYEDRRVLEANNNVVIVDIKKGDTIYTEQIIWDQNRRVIYSSTPVKRVNKDGSTLYGDGFDADESFESYQLRRPRGSMVIDKEQ